MAAVALACYLAWCPRVTGDKDSPEFTLVLATLGVAHPTGYPLYTLLGHLFVSVLHAWGASWAYAANAWSALGGALAVGLLHALATRLLAGAGVRSRFTPLLVLPAVAVFALDPVWTYEATLAEVNSWHLAWAAGAALYAAGLLQGPAPRGRSLVTKAALWGLLVGVGLAHHRTSVWISGPFTLALLAHARPRNAAPWLAACAGALAPLLSYGYIFWRASHPAAVQWPSLVPGAIGLHLSGAGYAHYLGHFAPSDVQRRLLVEGVFPWLAPALLAACVWPFLRGGARVLRLALAAAVLVQTAYAFFYGVPDPSSYFLVPLALGLSLVPATLAALPRARRFGAPLAIAAALVVAAAGRTWPRVAAERVSVFAKFDALTRPMWTGIPRERGFVIWEDDMSYRLVAYQLLDGLKPGLVVVNPVTFKNPLARRTFAARHGFDPAGDLPPAAAYTEGEGPELDPLREAVVDRLARTGEPVLVFLPQVPSVRLLREGGSVAGARDAAGDLPRPEPRPGEN